MQFDKQDIWRYLNEEMTVEERKNYTALIEQEPELQKLIQEEQPFVQFLQEKESKDQAFRNLGDIHSQFFVKSY